MKKYFLLVGFLILVTCTSNTRAQKNQFGFLGGYNISTLEEKDVHYNYYASFGLGIFWQFNIGNHIAFCFEPMYLRKGGKFTEDVQELENLKAKIKIGYIEIPAFLKLRLTVHSVESYLMAGPSIGLAISTNLTYSSQDTEIEVDGGKTIKTFDYGVGFGGGITFPFKRNTLFVEARYSMGLTDIAEEGDILIYDQPVTIPDAEVKTRGIQIMAGIVVPLGKK